MTYPYERRSLYRSRKGLLFGVCRGFAERFSLSVFWTRIIVLIAFIFTGFWPVGVVYLAAALLLKREPGPWQPVYRGCVMDAHAGAARACRRAADGLEGRLRRMEAACWESRLHDKA